MVEEGGGDGGDMPGEEVVVGGCGGSRGDGVAVAAPRLGTPPADRHTTSLSPQSGCSRINTRL